MTSQFLDAVKQIDPTSDLNLQDLPYLKDSKILPILSQDYDTFILDQLIELINTSNYLGLTEKYKQYIEKIVRVLDLDKEKTKYTFDKISSSDIQKDIQASINRQIELINKRSTYSVPNNLFICAAKHGDVELLKMFKYRYISPITTALDEAIQYSNIDTIKYLHSRGISTGFCTSTHTINTVDMEKIKYIFENMNCGFGMYELNLALGTNNEIFKYLYELFIKDKNNDVYGTREKLIELAVEHDNLEMVEYLHKLPVFGVADL